MRYLNRWSAACGWLAAMAVAWFTLVPSVLSLSSWVFAVAGGEVLIIGGAMFWESSRPTPSPGQARAAADAAPRDAAPRSRP
jgi:hypothetical protein